MNRNKIVAIVILMVVFSVVLKAQNSDSPNLESLINLGIKNGTSAHQLKNINQELVLNQSNANSNFMPKLSLNGAATYQTAVTKLDVNFPGFEFDSPQKDQYKVTLDLQQNIYDGGATAALKKFNEANNRVEQIKVETENDLLKEMISELYFNSVLLDKQKVNLQRLKTQLQLKLSRTIDNKNLGTATNLSVQQLKTKLVELDQQLRDIHYKKSSVIESINILVGETYSSEIEFIVDQNMEYNLTSSLQRNELKLMESKQELLSASKEVIDSKYAPKLFLAGTLGYGRPGLNFLSRDISTYGLFGLNLKIPMEHFYTRGKENEKKLNALQSIRIEDQKQNFIKTQSVKLKSQESEIARFQSTIETDRMLIEIKKNMLITLESQFDNGIITQREYLEELENITIAENTLALHEIQLAQAIFNYKLLKGLI